ncbi:hypothetical protein AS9A_2657 [Hoyosella subflava DQS3-9A1]|uniref:Uncharacterized protein n=1 Tax=Hoyosella subflava (strain DSM 45089 / JCM 17490 / NBRC 109087 / DQS3-9A1) TaxID=443218 RepID=F6EHC5_HOYSD|nr:hypothetical protein AS9A_2657 [Hoyosella subflava DQS3-9A1]
MQPAVSAKTSAGRAHRLKAGHTTMIVARGATVIHNRGH